MDKTKRKTGWWWETGHKSRVLLDILGCRLPRRDVDEVTRCTNPELCDTVKIGGQKHTEDILSMGLKDITQKKMKKEKTQGRAIGSSNIWITGRGGE